METNYKLKILRAIQYSENLRRAIPAIPILLIGQSVFQNRLKVTHITNDGKTT